MKSHVRDLKSLQACSEAREWAESHDDPQAAWAACERGDWMLWLCGRLSGYPESEARKKLVLLACECARLAPPIKGSAEWEAARLNCLDVAEKGVRGEGSVAQLGERGLAPAAAAPAAYAAAAAAAYAAASAAAATAYAAT